MCRFVESPLEEISERVRETPSERGCNCGRKNKDGDNITSCNNPRCPCFTAKVSCSRVCRCKGCCNPLAKSVPEFASAADVECSCRKSPVSCKDGIRKSKCPCLRNGKKCVSCRCKNCGNGNVNVKSLSGPKRRRTHEPTFKRTKGCDYLAQQGFEINCGPWTELETIVLLVILDILQESRLDPTVVNISFIYRHLLSSAILQNSGLLLEQKRNSQIAGKMCYIKKNLNLRNEMLEKEAATSL